MSPGLHPEMNFRPYCFRPVLTGGPLPKRGLGRNRALEEACKESRQQNKCNESADASWLECGPKLPDPKECWCTWGLSYHRNEFRTERLPYKSECHLRWGMHPIHLATFINRAISRRRGICRFAFMWVSMSDLPWIVRRNHVSRIHAGNRCPILSTRLKHLSTRRSNARDYGLPARWKRGGLSLALLGISFQDSHAFLSGYILLTATLLVTIMQLDNGSFTHWHVQPTFLALDLVAPRCWASAYRNRWCGASWYSIYQVELPHGELTWPCQSPSGAPSLWEFPDRFLK